MGIRVGIRARNIQATRSERGLQVLEQPITSCKPTHKENGLHKLIVSDDIVLYGTGILIFWLLRFYIGFQSSR